MSDSSEAVDSDAITETSDASEIPPYQPKQGLVGRGLYVLGYVFHGIRRHKRRSISLLIGVMIGVALISSVFVWTDTGTRIATEDYFAQLPYHYYCVQRGNFMDPNSYAIFPVEQWVNNQPTTRQSHVISASHVFIEPTGWRPNDPYLPYAYQNGLKDCQIFFVNNEFLERLEPHFDFTGSFRLPSAGSVLVSRRVVEDALTILGIEITIGSSIDLLLIRNIYRVNVVGDTWPFTLGDFRVVGIYDDIPRYDPIHQAFPSQTRQNWGPFSGQEVVFGWADSIMVLESNLTPGNFELITQRVMYPRLLVEVDPIYFFAEGLDRTIPILDSLFARIQENFDVVLGGRTALNNLEVYIRSYYERRSMGILVLPIIILSILLTIFTSTIFMSGRRPEIAILRSRGASYRQLYATLISEFIVLSVIALIIGGLIGILIGSLIPSATAFLQFDVNIFMRFYNLSRVDLFGWGLAALICILPPGIYTVFVTRSFLKTELYQSIRGNNNRWSPPTWMQVLYIITVIAVFWPLTSFILTMPLDVDLAFVLFIVAIAFWILLCDACARLLRPSIAGFSRIFRPVFGQKSHLFAKSVRVRRQRIIPLLIILILTFSVTIFAAVTAQTYQSHLDRQIDYFVGGDIRIYSGPVPAQRVDEIINVPHIRTATAFIETRANIGEIQFRLLGIDPNAYAVAGNWDETSMIGDDFQTVLARLAANPSGVILPHHLATQLNRHNGDTIDIDVWDQRIVFLETKTFDVVGEVYSAPGFGFANPSDPAASIAPVPGFGFQKSQPYAFVHKDYFLIEVPSWKVYDYVNNTQTFIATLASNANIESALEAVSSIDFVYTTWSPQTFDLEEVYPDGYLYAQGVISLLSVGFLAALVISVVALTVFVNTIVNERKIEYAIMRAMGGTRRQVTAIVLGEFFGLIMAAFLLSLLLGAGFSWLLMFTLLRIFPQPYVIPFNVIYPFTLLVAILGLVLLGLVAGAYLPARRAGSVQVTTILRNL